MHVTEYRPSWKLEMRGLSKGICDAIRGCLGLASLRFNVCTGFAFVGSSAPEPTEETCRLTVESTS